MLWADLRDELSDLYPEAASAERVVADALLSTRYIKFEGTNIDLWERILREADRRGKMLDLVLVAEHEYPDRAPIKIARVILESGGRLRDTPRIQDEPLGERGTNGFAEMVFEALGAMREELRDLRKDGDRRGEKLYGQLSDLRLETQKDMSYIKPLVENQGLQLSTQATRLEAHSTQLKAQAEMIKAHAKSIQSLEERPEIHASRKVIWIALALGLATVLGGELFSALVHLWLSL